VLDLLVGARTNKRLFPTLCLLRTPTNKLGVFNYMPAGRPLKFKDNETLKSKIDEYFANTMRSEWTITGLCLALDTSRETLMNYEKREQFFDTIKRAKDKVQNEYELDLRRKGRSGDIFALKNFGWTDKQEIESKVVVRSELEEEELDGLLSKYAKDRQGDKKVSS